MTEEQLTAIKEMQLTPDNMTELMEDQGLRIGAAAGAGGRGSFQPPTGVDVGGAGGRGGQFGAFGTDQDLSAEEKEAALAERMSTMMTGIVVSMLEARAEGESWEIAATNQKTVLQGELIAAIAEATGLDQGEIMTQARAGQTLLATAEANGANVDEVVAQVVTTDTERVNQAVAGGLLEQADAEEWLDGLQAQVKEMLEGPLQFGNRGASGS
jgi:hypothetical protein